ncbi:MAG: histidine kinase, partial [Saprospiraceae bacterium]|nr:histidine kinase [Saprospiraceae bacterium]
MQMIRVHRTITFWWILMAMPAVLPGQLPDLKYTYLPELPQHARSACILQDSRGMVWIAYEAIGNRIVVFDGQTNRQILPNTGDSTTLQDGNIEEIIEGPDGRLWMATVNQGLAIYDPGTDNFSSVNVREGAGLQFNTVRDIWFDTSGDLWMACRGALVRYDPVAQTFQTHRLSLAHMDSLEIVDANRMHRIEQDPVRSEVLWIGTLGGLISFDQTTGAFRFHRSPYTNVVRPNRVKAQHLVIDMIFHNDSTLILGTWSGGVQIYHTRSDEWERYFDPRRTPEFNVYYDIESKDEDEIWVNSNVGFGVFNLGTHEFSYYDSVPIPHIYPGGRYANQMLQLNPRDLIVVGSSGGILGHLAGATPDEEELYPPTITAIAIDGTPIRPRNLRFHQPTLTIGREGNTVSIRIVAPRFYQPDSVYYRYQLTGVDRTWRTSRGSANLSYDLEGGSYELLYQASLDGETWVDGEPWRIEKFVSFWASRELKFLILAVILGGIILYFSLVSRQRRKRAELERSYQHLLAESEMSALRAQMNPHFIFNSLNSIKMHVMKQDTQVANHYLTRFSHLMRLVLRNSKSKLITLADELQALELYIEIEKLRFDDGFDSHISVDDAVDPEELFIPPMLVQPYVENAIWHGLMHKKERGKLQIDVRVEQDQLHLLISDDGVGRQHSDQAGTADRLLKKSYGMRITGDRIALIKQSLGIDAAVEVHDLVHDDGSPAGTRVELTLPVISLKQAQQWIEPSD